MVFAKAAVVFCAAAALSSQFAGASRRGHTPPVGSAPALAVGPVVVWPLGLLASQPNANTSAGAMAVASARRATRSLRAVSLAAVLGATVGGCCSGMRRIVAPFGVVSRSDVA